MVNQDKSDFIEANKIFHIGIGRGAGSRSDLAGSKDGKGLFDTSWSSGTGDAGTTLYSFNGSDMVEANQKWEYIITSPPRDLANRQVKLNFFPDNTSMGGDESARAVRID